MYFFLNGIPGHAKHTAAARCKFEWDCLNVAPRSLLRTYSANKMTKLQSTNLNLIELRLYIHKGIRVTLPFIAQYHFCPN